MSQAKATFTMKVNPKPVLYSGGAIADAQVGSSYVYNVAGTASSGIPPYKFAVTAGALPAGLSMDANGNITGTPTAVETASFEVTVTDSGA